MKKMRAYCRPLAGWAAGEERREEMKLCSSSRSFCAAQVPGELCKGADEKERERGVRKAGKRIKG